MKFACKIVNGQIVAQKPDALRLFASKRPNIRYSLEPLIPESRNIRRFYHGAILSLWAYLDGADYTDGDVLERYHEIAKQEFNYEVVFTKFKAYKIAGSTRNKLNEGYLEKIIDFLEEQYGIDRTKVLNPEDYKYWKDCIRPDGGPDNFIDYMKAQGILK